MNVTNVFVLLSFVAGLIPALILLVMYGFRTDWKGNPGGQVIFSLIVITVASYSLSVATLAWPSVFHGETGERIRIAGRLLIAAGLWNLLRLFFMAQGIGRSRQGRADDRAELDADNTPAGE